MLGSALAEVTGPLKDFADKLGGEDGVEWLEAFKRFLRKEETWQKPQFSVWKTLKLGGYKTVAELIQAVKDGSGKISEWATDILGKPAFTVAPEETEVDLVKVTVAELGFKKGATHKQIYKRAQELGLQICPSEVGPQLRRQYADQPNNEWILIGMKPIRDSGGDLDVFHVVRGDGGLWLNTYFGRPDSVCGADDQWVFVHPRK